jgi:hypothetical protein
VANRIESQFDQTKGKFETGAVKAVKSTGTFMWVVFISLALGLLAALFGGSAGVTSRQRVWAERVAREPLTS